LTLFHLTLVVIRIRHFLHFRLGDLAPLRLLFRILSLDFLDSPITVAPFPELAFHSLEDASKPLSLPNSENQKQEKGDSVEDEEADEKVETHRVGISPNISTDEGPPELRGVLTVLGFSVQSWCFHFAT